MVIRNQSIELVPLGTVVDIPGYRSVYFKRPNHFEFESGDWIDLSFAGIELSGGKTYSLSSSPTEADLRISFREGKSELKRALQSVTSYQRLRIEQYGNDYGFQLKKNQSSVLIAGGVGIAPFRSMIKEMFDRSYKNDVMLIYLNTHEEFVFKEELDYWSRSMPNVSVRYISTKLLNRKKRDALVLSFVASPQQNFYISGPPGMVEHTEHLLIDYGVLARDIRIDSFGGY